MGEVVQEQRFQCRFCSKRFFSGKSLGGHMRSHLALISAARGKDKQKIKKEDEEEGGGHDHCRIDDGAQQNIKNFSPVLSNSSFSDDEDDHDQESSGLRGNSGKKSLRASSNLVQSDDGGVKKGHGCKECFREFTSARALAGHMRTHSLKLMRNQEQDEHVCKTCGRGFDSVRALYGHMKSHSKRERFRSVSADFDLVYPRKKRSVLRHINGLNMSVSEEVVNAALGLMMLSKDTWDCNDFGDPGERKGRDLGSCFSDTNDIVSEFQEEPKNNGASDQCPLALGLDCEGDLNSPDASKCNEDDGTESVVSGSLKRKYKCVSCDKMFRTHQALGGHRNRSRTSGSCCPTNTECNDTSPDEAMVVFEPSKISKEEHECEICFKVFATGQALGGHKRAHYNANQELRCVQNSSIFGLNDAAMAHQDGVGFKPWWIGNALLT